MEIIISLLLFSIGILIYSQPAHDNDWGSAPYTDETIAGEVAAVIAALPLVGLFVARERAARPALVASALTFLLVQCIKVAFGVPRPDYEARLETGNPDIIQDGLKSFPSGHVAMVSCSMAALTLVAAMRLPAGPLYMLLSITPQVVVIFIAATRVWDHRHYVIDVAAGYAMGACLCMLCFNWASALRE